MITISADEATEVVTLGRSMSVALTRSRTRLLAGGSPVPVSGPAEEALAQAARTITALQAEIEELRCMLPHFREDHR